ncbi:MAG: hypothetical protein ACE5OZ_06085 [Candidatus Heimdallarchaeota archaeon]
MSGDVHQQSLLFLRSSLKGYSSYENPSKREKTDQILRQRLNDYLVEYLDKAREAQEAAIFTQMTVIWPDVELLCSRLELLLNIVKKTDYETSTFFSSNLEGFDQRVLIMAEAEIIKLLDDLRDMFGDFYDSIESGLLDVSSNLMAKILQSAERIKQLYTERLTLIRDYKKF